jgi:hypothetical protein
MNKKGTKILYVKLQKALYGLMRASLIFYRKLRKEFKDYGLVVNLFNPCAANMMTRNGSQLTAVWHVDNLMVLCVEDFKLTTFLCYLGDIYGPKLNMHTGKKHDYLGVDMECNDDGVLDLVLIKYLQNFIKDFSELITGRAATPAADHLFNVRDEKETRVSEEEWALVFHRMVTQLLFMSTRARQDIKPQLLYLPRE